MYLASDQDAAFGVAEAEASAPPAGAPFGYYFPGAAQPRATDMHALDELAACMYADPDAPVAEADVSAAHALFAQLVCNDVSVDDDRETRLGAVERDDVEPAPRREIVARLGAGRGAPLRLEVLYGDADGADPRMRRLSGLMRDRDDRARMAVGGLQDLGWGLPDLPADGGGDLPRLGSMVQGPERRITAAELRALPRRLRTVFVKPNGKLRVQRAVIGDARSDDSLPLAQMHLALLRAHNRIVDGLDPAAAPDARFEAARRTLRWTVQWLVMNDLLPRLCGAETMQAVIARGAPLYSRFREARRGAAAAPAPLEFAAGAGRFVHAMTRPVWDWSGFHGAPDGRRPRIQSAARLEALRAMTGCAPEPMRMPGGEAAERLPGHWAPDWSRLIADGPDSDGRRAAAIDTRLAPQLADMESCSDVLGGALRDMARRTLRRGLALNLPSGQDCVAGLQATVGVHVPALCSDALTAGEAGRALEAGGLVAATPLWFYVLREAETAEGGRRLGPLGARLVAETLAGMIIADPWSYWHAPGADRGRWRPADGPTEAVGSVPDLIRFAGLV